MKVGVQKSSARLTVTLPPLKFIKPLPEFTVVGLKADAEFLTELNREDAEVQWLRNGTVITKSTRYTITSEKTFRKLVVHNVTLEDQYEYTCTVETIKTSSKLKVGGELIILISKEFHFNCVLKC